MNLPSTPPASEAIAAIPTPPVVPVAPAVSEAASTRAASDTLSLASKPKVDPEDIRKATEKAEADYKRLREIMQRTMISGSYPPLDTIERLARMIAASPSTAGLLNSP